MSVDDKATVIIPATPPLTNNTDATNNACWILKGDAPHDHGGVHLNIVSIDVQLSRVVIVLENGTVDYVTENASAYFYHVLGAYLRLILVAKKLESDIVQLLIEGKKRPILDLVAIHTKMSQLSSCNVPLVHK